MVSLSLSPRRLGRLGLGSEGAPEVPPARHVHHRPEPCFHGRSNLGMKGQGCPGGSRVVGVGVELVGLSVEAPDEEEAGNGGGEEDEDHPQRAHLFSCCLL
uniref:Uncharacterized protein n=1 Tax=Zea mays TaxID=4577 RepID=C0PML8_MAIZE|nr:unknown [Zea mays]